jgi:hypothetical protein
MLSLLIAMLEGLFFVYIYFLIVVLFSRVILYALDFFTFCL